MGRLASEVARVVRPGGVWVIEVPAPAWLDHVERLLAAGHGTGREEARVVRTGARTCRYDDLVVGASIEARVLDAAEWRSALGDRWVVEVEPLGAVEWLVVARRTH
jgi:hypothetical protein